MFEGHWFYSALLWREDRGARGRAGVLDADLVPGYPSPRSCGNSMHYYHLYPEITDVKLDRHTKVHFPPTTSASEREERLLSIKDELRVCHLKVLPDPYIWACVICLIFFVGTHKRVS